MKVKDLLTEVERVLSKKFEDARSQAEYILSYLLNLKKYELYLAFNNTIDESILDQLSEILKKRLANVPLAYIFNRGEFMGLEFKLNECCFIPRAETEVLVEEALKIINHNSIKSLVDIGCGCGNIAISIAKYSNINEIYATDINENLLELVETNAKLNNVGDKIKCLAGDMFIPLSRNGKRFDMVVSNPPYLSIEDLRNLPPEVSYEPIEAIYGGEDGLWYYRCISNGIKDVLNEHGFLIVEIGFGQSEKIKKIFHDNKIEIIKIAKDYNGIDRVIIGKLKGVN